MLKAGLLLGMAMAVHASMPLLARITEPFRCLLAFLTAIRRVAAMTMVEALGCHVPFMLSRWDGVVSKNVIHQFPVHGGVESDLAQVPPQSVL